MIRFRDLGLLAVAAALCACSSGSVAPTAVPEQTFGTSATRTSPATTYTFVDLGPAPNGHSAYAYGANKTHQAGAYAYTTISCGKDCSSTLYHALAWSGSGSTPVDINPPIINFAESWVYGGSGNLLVGTGLTDNGGYLGYPHAMIWHGSTFTWKDINPAGDSFSDAYATNGSSIVGDGNGHALLWLLTNLSNPTDLHPGPAYSSSVAYGINGTRQVGSALTNSTTPARHAILWNGTAASAIDLTPAGSPGADGYGIDSSHEVGCGVIPPATSEHALLWKGSAASVIDLNPATFLSSCARAVRLGVEAGYGETSGRYTHALVWNGTAASAFDLQTTMPATGYFGSEAFGIDAAGNIIGAAWATSGWHGAMWIKQ